MPRRSVTYHTRDKTLTKVLVMVRRGRPAPGRYRSTRGKDKRSRDETSSLVGSTHFAAPNFDVVNNTRSRPSRHATALLLNEANSTRHLGPLDPGGKGAGDALPRVLQWSRHLNGGA